MKTFYRGALAICGLVAISTVGCDPAQAQEVPANKGICWDMPTTNVDGSPLDDLDRYRFLIVPQSGQLPYSFFFSSDGVQPAPDENGKQCIRWQTTGSAPDFVPGLLSKFLSESERCNCDLFGLWKVRAVSVDKNNNVTPENFATTIDIFYQGNETVAPRAPANIRYE